MSHTDRIAFKTVDDTDDTWRLNILNMLDTFILLDLFMPFLLGLVKFDPCARRCPHPGRSMAAWPHPGRIILSLPHILVAWPPGRLASVTVRAFVRAASMLPHCPARAASVLTSNAIMCHKHHARSVIAVREGALSLASVFVFAWHRSGTRKEYVVWSQRARTRA